MTRAQQKRRLSPFDLMQKTEVPEGKTEKFTVQRFTVSEEDSSLDRMRSLFSGSGRYVPPGTYTRLTGKGRGVIMSDTPDEMRDHYSPVAEAKGHCLIHGLGLGIVTEACLRKDEVTKVTVIEIEQDIIDLVGPFLMERWGDRLEIICADCLTWQPPKGARYGMVWHDIWDTMCLDNNDQYVKLHRRYGKRRADWQGSWGRWFIEREKRESRERRYSPWGF